MKDHWQKLPSDNPLRRRIESALSADLSPAAAWMNAASIAWPAGYDIDPPPHGFSDRLVVLRKSDQRAAGKFTLDRSTELADERCAARLYAGRRAWAAGPPQHEIAAARIAAKVTAEREAAIEARAAQLVAEQTARSTETARARARKEITT
jgi:hypothetical protein